MEDRRILIDTSVIIRFARTKDKSQTLLWQLMEEYECYCSVITLFELYNGAKQDFHHQILSAVFRWIKTIDFTKNTAHKASEIYRELKKSNQLIEFRDIFIGATALIESIPLATFNTKHFNRINNLKIIPVDT